MCFISSPVGLSQRWTKCKSQAQKLNSKPASFFRWDTDHIPACTQPQCALFIKMAHINKGNFSIKLYFKPKGQILPSHDYNITSTHTYPGSTSAWNLLNYKHLKESRWSLLTNPEFYDLMLRCNVGNTHWNLWSLWLKSLALHQAQTRIPQHFILSHWHIHWQVHTRGLCG